MAQFNNLEEFAVLTSVLFLAGIIYVKTRNYLRLRNEKFTPDWQIDEKPVDSIQSRGLTSRSHTVLTNRRVLQMRVSWLLSKRIQYAIALSDVQAVIFNRHMNLAILVLALVAMPSFAPLSLVLMMMFLESKVCATVFDTPWNAMPWTRIAARTHRRKKSGDFFRFYRNAQFVWARVRAEKGLATPSAITDETEFMADPEFEWGRPVWVYVLAMMAVALLQRQVESQVSFAPGVFAALYLAIPLASVHRSMRDGVWTAIVGVLGVLTVKYPNAVLSDSHVLLEDCLGVMFSMVVITLAGYMLSKVNVTLRGLALLLWPFYVYAATREGVSSLGLLSTIAFGGALVVVLGALDEALARVPDPEPEQQRKAAVAAA